MSSPYEIRTNDNGKSKKQSMAELKLRRLTELNQRLQEDLNRRRIPVSEAAMEYVSLHLSAVQHRPLPRQHKRGYESGLLIVVQPDRLHGQRAQGFHGTQSMGHSKQS